MVEVLHDVPGLDREDLDAVVQIQESGVTYRLLDPIAMLKAKAANIRRLNQEGRHDRAHLQIIARCVRPFLQDAHRQAVENVSLREAFFKTLTRTFQTLRHRQTLKTLRQEAIQPVQLIPLELPESPIEKVRTACQHQLPRLAIDAAR